MACNIATSMPQEKPIDNGFIKIKLAYKKDGPDSAVDESIIAMNSAQLSWRERWQLRKAIKKYYKGKAV